MAAADEAEGDGAPLQFALNDRRAGGATSTRPPSAARAAGGVNFADDHDDQDHDDQTNQTSVRQEITTFDGQAGTTKRKAAAAKLVIPSLPNTFKDGRRYVPSFVPDQIKKEEDLEGGNGVKFETGMVIGEEKAGDGGAYGLELRNYNGGDTKTSQLMQGRHPHAHAHPHARQSHQERETAALRGDLQHLPPESTVEEYERMPVEAFGEALLRGMGWKEGRGIGRGKQDVEAKELVRRADRLGLGADPAATGRKEKRFIKPGESREDARGGDMVYVDEKTGVMKSSRPVGSDAKLKKRSELGVVAGKTMYVAGGKHSGFACEVKSVERAAERAMVRLLPSMETVRVSFKDLEERGVGVVGGGGKEEGPAAKKAKTTTGTNTTTNTNANATTPWLYPNIRVRVVDKKASKGRYYLKKGTIVDVKTPETCDVFIDDFREVVQDLHQRQLETVVPKGEGGVVLCVAGKWKGRQGTLLRRNKKSDYVACQLEDEAEILKLHLDDVCELVVREQ